MVVQHISSRKFDLEERTAQFAQRARDFLEKVPKTLVNVEYIKQLARCTPSIGANYIEGNDALGKNDFLMKVKTSRREAKESIFWLRLLNLEKKVPLEQERQYLINESQQFVRIFSAMLQSFTRKTQEK